MKLTVTPTLVHLPSKYYIIIQQLTWAWQSSHTYLKLNLVMWLFNKEISPWSNSASQTSCQRKQVKVSTNRQTLIFYQTSTVTTSSSIILFLFQLNEPSHFGTVTSRSYYNKEVAIIFVVQSLSPVRLFCDPMDCSPPSSSVHRILQARILEWVAISFSRGLPHPGIEPISLASPAQQTDFFTTEPPGKPKGLLRGLNDITHVKVSTQLNDHI